MLEPQRGHFNGNEKENESAHAQEQKAAEDEALKIQRAVRLDDMTMKRVENFCYLERVHRGGCFWLNCYLISKEDLIHLARNVFPPQRALQFFYLSISLTRLLELEGGATILRSALQLMEEWEFFFSSNTNRGVKSMIAKSAPSSFPHSDLHLPSEAFKPGLHKFANEVVYEFLQTPPLPFSPDYFETVTALCRVFSSLYQHLNCPTVANHPTVYEDMAKFDTKIKHSILNLMAKEFNDFVIEQTASTLDLLRGAHSAVNDGRKVQIDDDAGI